jgi:hypothetical protein
MEPKKSLRMMKQMEQQQDKTAQKLNYACITSHQWQHVGFRSLDFKLWILKEIEIHINNPPKFPLHIELTLRAGCWIKFCK